MPARLEALEHQQALSTIQHRGSNTNPRLGLRRRRAGVTLIHKRQLAVLARGRLEG